MDLLETIDEIHQYLGAQCGGPSALETLSFLDSPALNAARIDAILATYEAPLPTPAPAPPPRLTAATPIEISKRDGKGLLPRHPDDVYVIPGVTELNTHAPPN